MKDRKKELREQYKNMKTEMGVFIIRSTSGSKCLLTATPNLKGGMNRARFQLSAGSHPCKELQKEWLQLGASHFVIETLEVLEYDKDESKTDYSEDLDLLKMIWEDKLIKQGKEFYQ